MIRLCVLISKCSRAFLLTWGEVRTQYLRVLVGRGIGPIASIPLDFTASIIFTQELSKIFDSRLLMLLFIRTSKLVGKIKYSGFGKKIDQLLS